MPQYFFVVMWPDQEVDDPEANDPESTRLPSDADAFEYAKRLTREIRQDYGPEEPELTVIVKNTAGETVFLFPF
jgi:hypothetical protein